MCAPCDKAFVLCSMIASIAWSVTVRGEEPSAPLPTVVELGESELAQYRGRYMRAGQLVYFGVGMNTQWTTGNGESMGVTMGFGVPVRKRVAVGDPELYQTVTVVDVPRGSRVEPSESGAAVSAYETALARPGRQVNVNEAGLRRTEGLVQRIHVAGDGNDIDNALRAEVLLSDKLEVPVAEPEATSGAVPSGVVETIATKDGALVTTRITPERFGFDIDVEGVGQVRQQIAGANNDDVTGVLQSVLLNADRHRIQNQLDLQAVFKPSTSGAAFSDNDALRSLINLQLNNN